MKINKTKTQQISEQLGVAVSNKDEDKILSCVLALATGFLENQERQTHALESIAAQLEQQTTELRNIEANGRKK